MLLYCHMSLSLLNKIKRHLDSGCSPEYSIHSRTHMLDTLVTRSYPSSQ